MRGKQVSRRRPHHGVPVPATPIRFEAIDLHQVCGTNEEELETHKAKLFWLRLAGGLLVRDDRQLEAKLLAAGRKDAKLWLNAIREFGDFAQRQRQEAELFETAIARLAVVLARLNEGNDWK